MPDEKEIIVVKHEDVDDVDLVTLRRYYRSLGEACELLTQRNKELELERDAAMRLRDAAIQNFEQQKKITTDNIMQTRQRELAISQELIEVKAELKKLKAK